MKLLIPNGNICRPLRGNSRRAQGLSWSDQGLHLVFAVDFGHLTAIAGNDDFGHATPFAQIGDATSRFAANFL